MNRVVGAGLVAALLSLVVGCGGSEGLAPVSTLGTAPAPVVHAAGSDASRYRVETGDTLYSIAWRFGLDYRAVAVHNGIREPFLIRAGDVLSIPSETEARRVDVGSAQGEVRLKPLPAEPAEPATALPAPRAPAVASRVTLPRPKPERVTAVKQAPAATQKKPPKRPKIARSVPVPKTATARRPTTAKKGRRTWHRPTRGRIVGAFGRGGGKGIDISGQFKQPVIAAADGDVVYSGGGLIGYGKLIIIKHDARYLSAYAHNDSLLVKEGEEVRGGQRIAEMGRSGTDRTKLHFEIRRDGKPVDPKRYLPR